MTGPRRTANGLPRNRVSKPVRRPINAVELAALREAPFQAQVVELARRSGWWVFHVHNSRRSEPGFPDIFAVRPPRVVLAELKRSKGGRVSPEQAHVLELLSRCPGVESFLWTPQDWPEVIETFTTLGPGNP